MDQLLLGTADNFLSMHSLFVTSHTINLIKFKFIGKNNNLIYSANTY